MVPLLGLAAAAAAAATPAAGASAPAPAAAPVLLLRLGGLVALARRPPTPPAAASAAAPSPRRRGPRPPLRALPARGRCPRPPLLLLTGRLLAVAAAGGAAPAGAPAAPAAARRRGPPRGPPRAAARAVRGARHVSDARPQLTISTPHSLSLCAPLVRSRWSWASLRARAAAHKQYSSTGTAWLRARARPPQARCPAALNGAQKRREHAKRTLASCLLTRPSGAGRPRSRRAAAGAASPP